VVLTAGSGAGSLSCGGFGTGTFGVSSKRSVIGALVETPGNMPATVAPFTSS
jgi:hypothetical protein